MDMLAELAIANAAFQVIKQTLSNGKEIADAGASLGKYFGAEKAIAKQVASGSGNVLEAFQAKEALVRQEEELKFMLNKQRLHGWKDFVAFKAAYTRELKEAELAARKQKAAKAKALDENLMVAMKVFGILIVILGALFGVAIYVR
jgi:hypothetical protein|tara:strand:- start:183 stop:620 length:438 start_codon:yes stop_codon:yes gene_type:complete